MRTKKQALLLVGSPGKENSTSASLGTFLIEKLQDHGFKTDVLFIYKSIRQDDSKRALLGKVRQADVVVIAFPLYVDSLPYLVVKSLEIIAKDRKEKIPKTEQSLLCIVNNGFPEASQNDTAIAICHRFAAETGFKWAGGLALGGGGAIGDKPLSGIKSRARNVIKSLEITANSLNSRVPLPQEAITLMARPIVPKWLYLLIATIGWKKTAKKFNTHKNLYDRPFLS